MYACLQGVSHHFGNFNYFKFNMLLANSGLSGNTVCCIMYIELQLCVEDGVITI